MPSRQVLWTCLLLTWYGVCHAGPVPEEEEFADLSEEEEACFKLGKFYSDKTKKCHELLSTGPCADDERFVLRKRHGEQKLVLKAVCIKSICGEKKYWPETDSCVSAADKDMLCGTSAKVVLSENVFGEGECACTKVPPHARLHDNASLECHELYQRGPCGYRQILAVPVGESTPQCIEDVCYDATLRLREEDEDHRRTAVWYKDGCYELEKSGEPCPNNGTLKISLLSHEPVCIHRTQTIFDFESNREDCQRDGDGNCGATLVLPDDYFDTAYKANIQATLEHYHRHKHDHSPPHQP